MLLQDADAEEGKQTLVGNLNELLKDRMNLESSLQVCNLNSSPWRAREVLLQSREKDFALHADSVGVYPSYQ